MNKNPKQSDKRLLWFLRVIVPLIPVIMVTILVFTLYGKHPLDVTLYWNDEVINWHQVASFREHSFDIGYYTINEQPAPAAFTHFYVHGPWYPIFVGLASKLLGWRIYSGVILNSVLITSALYFFVFVMRLDRRQLLALAGVIASAYVITLYVTINMQETLQQSVSIILAMLFYIALKDQQSLSVKKKVAFVLFLLLATITRLSWGVLLLPYFLLVNRRSLRGVVLALVETGILSFVAIYVVYMTTPPGLHSVFDTAENIVLTPIETLSTIMTRTMTNASVYLDVGHKKPLDILQTFQALIFISMLFVTLFTTIFFRKLPKKLPQLARSVPVSSLGFHLYNLVSIHLASFGLYIIGTWGDYRVIATHLLVTMLIMILARSYRLLPIYVLGNLLFFLLYISTFASFTSQKYLVEHERLLSLEQQVVAVMSYNDTVENQWCNTILIHVYFYNDVVTTIPPGIGTTLFFTEESIISPKSQYLWLRDDDPELLARLETDLQLDFLLQMPQGKLYRNTKVNCP